MMLGKCTLTVSEGHIFSRIEYMTISLYSFKEDRTVISHTQTVAWAAVKVITELNHVESEHECDSARYYGKPKCFTAFVIAENDLLGSLVVDFCEFSDNIHK